MALFEEVSGENLADVDPNATFLELGFDSLFLGRIVQHIRNRFGVTVTFRQLLNAIPSAAALAEHIAREVPAPAAPPPALSTPALPAPALAAATLPASAASSIEGVMRDQLAAMQSLMRDQLVALERLGQTGSVATAVPTPIAPAAAVPAAATPRAPESAASDTSPEPPSRFDAFKITSGPKADVTPAQQAHIDALIAQTVARTGGSKGRTAAHRAVLADPRVAAGFRTEWKEMVYPITCVRAKGSRLWDIDGNEYIDLLNGFGQTAFGHSPDFVVDAVNAQLADGFAIGPQTDLAGQVAELFCEMTGNARVTFCNTGSEAVMAAMRVARTVTGRDMIVVFDGAYHGQFDEVLVKSARRSTRSLPVAAGIPNGSVANMTVLEYGAPASLAWIREHAAELAAVIVEPVQSRHPGLVPRAFLAELREITAASGSALVFDEVVTGFRVHPGGMQAVFDIRADLATYGKVAGGGMPVGILAGTTRFMDALDGGTWNYGDDSFPHVAPTFFAGTFVRHPL
ncbi:MAG TPA: aminotransferase class III-fold pyridoxal phosphate-dependent enzyme, partial [Candidatus Lustribacter sp.]|nr:aminotransferase class III-fold pyridoxal phosphate-dependent enzyme [Candidatus Lustribacter sp.]